MCFCFFKFYSYRSQEIMQGNRDKRKRILFFSNQSGILILVYLFIYNLVFSVDDTKNVKKSSFLFIPNSN